MTHFAVNMNYITRVGLPQMRLEKAVFDNNGNNKVKGKNGTSSKKQFYLGWLLANTTLHPDLVLRYEPFSL